MPRRRPGGASCALLAAIGASSGLARLLEELQRSQTLYATAVYTIYSLILFNLYPEDVSRPCRTFSEGTYLTLP
jgi:hypothetical protein